MRWSAATYTHPRNAGDSLPGITRGRRSGHSSRIGTPAAVAFVCWQLAGALIGVATAGPGGGVPGSPPAVMSPAPTAPSPDDMRLLRMPDIYGDRVVFVYGGDLWLVSAEGGEARRLTSFDGYESYPKFSPDGTLIAFSGEYDGNNDVYVMPAEGGEPRRLTWNPAWDRVIGWQPDGKSVRFQSPRGSHTGRDLQLWTVPITGGLPTSLGLPTGGLSSYAPDGQQMAYNRVSTEERTWKRYKGGWAQDLWIFDFAHDRSHQITDWPGTENFPMWHGDTIYFTSDRSGRLEIWAHDVKTGKQRQVTSHDEYDVKWPSLGPDAIVYENGGWLYVMDLSTEKSRKLKVTLHDDRLLARPTFKDFSDRIESFDVSPDAKRAVFCARGELFTVPAEKGDVRDISTSPAVREMAPAWSPDGRWIAYLSDRTGEYEIWVRAGDGKGEERQVTKGSHSYRFDLTWSPDSKFLVFSDSNFDLQMVEVETGRITVIDHDPISEITRVAWSPDSRWFAYAKTETNHLRSIFLYDSQDKKITQVTSEMTDDANPVFDPEGQYLYFTSARHFQPGFAGYDLNPIWTQQDGLYLVTLKQDAPDPFAPQSDEAAIDAAAESDGDSLSDAAKGQQTDKKGAKKDAQKDGKKTGKKDKGGQEEEDETKENKKAPPEVEIDLAGIGDRIVALPVDNGNFGQLSASEGKLFYVAAPMLRLQGGDSGDRRGGSALKVFVMEDREEKAVLDGIRGYVLSADGKKILYAMRDSYGIVDAAPEQKPSEKPLRTGEMKALVDPRAEWAQILRDVWRLERDFFYDPGMHGVDWSRMGERYGQLVPYVAHRADLGYLIGEMIGELNCSHTYTGGGDMPQPQKVGVGVLGCDFLPDPQVGRYQLVDILTQRDWNDDEERTPLHGLGIDVKEGEYLLAVDGVELRTPTNPYSLFEEKVDKQVVLRVGPRADGKDARDLTVEPIGSEQGLRYVAWVNANRQRVDELSAGRIGYLHLPNTAVAGTQEFAKGYYPQLLKDGLIIDERFNGGGFIPDFFMNILRQKVVNLWGRRPGMQSEVTPATAFPGYLAMVSNGYAGSGGDALPYYFKFYELGPVIGTRTWGGLVGIDRGIRTVDGGRITMPAFGLFNTRGEWDVEGHGVEPDIAIDNLPEQEMAGHDPQLEKAVQVLLGKIDAAPPRLPERPNYPRNKLK